MVHSAISPAPTPPGPRQFHAAAPDGTRLYVRANGGGSTGELTTLLTDGILCDGFIYRYLWDDLQPVSRVAHWNFRGHGRSGVPQERDAVDVPHHGQDVGAVRDALGDPPVVLVGHSFGATVVLEAYRQRPERVAALVLLCGSHGRLTHTFKGTDQLAQNLPRMAALVARYPRLVRSILHKVPPGLATHAAKFTGDVDARTLDPADMHTYFEHISTLDMSLMLEMVHCAGEYSAQDFLEEIDVPVLVVAGEKDSFVPPDVSRAMAERIPKSTFCLMPGATHVAPIEQPHELSLRVERFLRDNDLI